MSRPIPRGSNIISNFLASIVKFIVAIALLKYANSLYFIAPELFQKTIWLVVMLSVVVASCQILVQDNLKRFFAYSAIIQSGYFSIALINPTVGINMVAYLAYLTLYSICSIIIFGIISCLRPSEGRGDQALTLSSLNGLAGSSKLLALTFSIALLGLIGLPPVVVTLFAKLNLIQVAISEEYFSLAMAIVFGTLVGGYYYFRLLGEVWSGVGVSLKTLSFQVKLALILLVILIAYYTIFPAHLFSYLAGLV